MWRPLTLGAGLLVAAGCAPKPCVATDTHICLDDRGGILISAIPPVGEGVQVVPTGFVLPPGLAICVDVVETPDAGTAGLSPADLGAAIDDPAIARLAEDGDCPTLGVIAIAPGEATLSVRRGEDTATARVIVLETRVGLRAEPQSLAVGERRPWRCGAGPCPTLVHPDVAISPRVRALDRGLTLESDAPAVASVELGAGGFEVVARTVGVATITGVYELFDGVYELAPAIITVAP